MPSTRLIQYALILLLMSKLGVAKASDVDPDLSTVQHVDLPRYMGRWFVIAHTPNFLERGKVGTSDTYSLLPDGTLRDVFRFKKHALGAPEGQWVGSAWVTDSLSNALWKIRIFWPLAVGYRILELDPNYGWAVVSTTSGRLFWVLSRTPNLDEATYRGIRERLLNRRLDPGRLELVLQLPSAS